MECPLLIVLTAVIVYGDNKRKCQLPCPAISAHGSRSKAHPRHKRQEVCKLLYEVPYGT